MNGRPAERKTFRLSARLGVEITAGTNGLTVEWEPAMPKRLTKAELRRYRAARNQMLTRLAGRLGGMMAVVEL